MIAGPWPPMQEQNGKLHRELLGRFGRRTCHAVTSIALGELLSSSKSPVIRSAHFRNSATLPSIGPGALQMADAPLKPAIAITLPSELNVAWNNLCGWLSAGPTATPV